MASRLDDRPTALRILEVAVDLFASRGYANTSINDVADGVGVLKGSLYYYFDTKEDLLYELFERLGRLTFAMMHEVESRTDLDSIGMLRHYVEQHIEQNAQNVALIRVYWRELESLGGERRAAIEEQRRTLNSFVEGLLRRVQAEGKINAALDVRMLTFFLFATVNYIHVWYQNNGRISPRELAVLFSDIAVAGVVNAKPGDGIRPLAP